MAEHVDLPANDRLNPELILRLKPDRRRASLGWRRPDNDGLVYPYNTVLFAVLVGHALLLSAFVAYVLR